MESEINRHKTAMECVKAADPPTQRNGNNSHGATHEKSLTPNTNGHGKPDEVDVTIGRVEMRG